MRQQAIRTELLLRSHLNTKKGVCFPLNMSAAAFRRSDRGDGCIRFFVRTGILQSDEPALALNVFKAGSRFLLRRMYQVFKVARGD